jgi:hypothetical protein
MSPLAEWLSNFVSFPPLRNVHWRLVTVIINLSLAFCSSATQLVLHQCTFACMCSQNDRINCVAFVISRFLWKFRLIFWDNYNFYQEMNSSINHKCWCVWKDIIIFFNFGAAREHEREINGKLDHRATHNDSI